MIVLPFAYALDEQESVLYFSLGSGIGVGCGVLFKAREKPHSVSLAIVIGSIVGIGAGLVITGFGSINASGIGLIIPPTVGMSIALVNAIGNKPICGLKDSLLSALLIGVTMGLGLVPLFWGFAAAPVAISLYVGAYVAAIATGKRFRHSGRSLSTGERVGWIVLLTVLTGVACFVIWIINKEFIYEVIPDGLESAWLAWYLQWRIDYGILSAAITGISTLILVPLLTYEITRLIAHWVKPRLVIYEQLIDYLRIMWIPVSAFAIGYAAIIVIFGGVYGSIFRLFGEPAFQSPNFESAQPTIADWLFFSFFNATAQDYNQIIPLSTLARLSVGVQLLLSVAWAVVIFAAVMSHLQPRLQRIAEEREQNGDSDLPT